jgi:hypothetical protein
LLVFMTLGKVPDPRERVPFFRVVFLDPRDKPECPTTASNLADREIDTRGESDNEKGCDFYARNILLLRVRAFRKNSFHRP